MTKENDRPTVLVLGASGSIGGALVQQLATDGGADQVKVRAAIRRPEAAERLRGLGVETTFLDLDGIERIQLGRNRPLLDALAGVDRLFLLTGYSVDMLVQSKAIIDAARHSGVRHVVHLGAWATDDTTIVHLGWHQFVERYIESVGLRFTHLRPSTFMQNILKFSLRDDGTIQQFIGDAKVSWVDTDDVARAAAAVLRSPDKHHGQTYPLAVEALTIAEVASLLSDVVGKPFRYQARSPDEFLAAAIAGGMEPTYARCVHNVFMRTADGSLSEAADVSGAFAQITGEQPTGWRAYAEKHRAEFLRRITK